MTLALADVKDTDCLYSRRPLVLRRMPGKYVTGPAAVLRRVLYAWLLPSTGPQALVYDPSFGVGLALLEGSTLGDGQLLGLRRALENAAEAEDFVLSASVPLALVDNELQVPATIKLVDGRTYALEVLLSSAGPALRALGA
jgi:hypothetical protein